MNPAGDIRFDPHALLRMRQRGITERQVRRVLRDPIAVYPARPLPHRAARAVVYVGRIDGRDLRVYVLEGSEPPLVLTVAWRDEDG